MLQTFSPSERHEHAGALTDVLLTGGQEAGERVDGHVPRTAATSIAGTCAHRCRGPRRENIRFYASIYEIPKTELDARIAATLHDCDLVGREADLPGALSTGVRQRLALGTATIHRPDILFLDEPTSGLDPVARRAFWDLLYELAAGGVTLFVTTHYMEEASNCTRLAFMYRGRIIADGTPAEIRTATLPRDPDGTYLGLPPGAEPTMEDVFVHLVTTRR